MIKPQFYCCSELCLLHDFITDFVQLTDGDFKRTMSHNTVDRKIFVVEKVLWLLETIKIF